jgi:hypothetical protein
MEQDTFLLKFSGIQLYHVLVYSTTIALKCPRDSTWVELDAGFFNLIQNN